MMATHDSAVFSPYSRACIDAHRDIQRLVVTHTSVRIERPVSRGYFPGLFYCSGSAGNAVINAVRRGEWVELPDSLKAGPQVTMAWEMAHPPRPLLAKLDQMPWTANVPVVRVRSCIRPAPLITQAHRSPTSSPELESHPPAGN